MAAVRDAVATPLGVAGCIDAPVNISAKFAIGALEECSEVQTNLQFADRFFDVDVLRLT